MSIKSLKTDILIVGAGPAGLTAGIYAARAGKKALILEGSGPSRLGINYKLENYPGFPSIDSRELLDIIRGQALSFGAEVVAGDAIAFALDGDREVRHDQGRRHRSPARSSWPRGSPCPRSA